VDGAGFSLKKDHAMADGPITGTSAASFIPDNWSGQTLDFREEVIVLANLFDQSFEKDAAFGDTVKVPNVTKPTVRTKAENTDVTFENVVESLTTITINVHTYAGIELEDLPKIQSKYDLQAKYAGKFGYVLGEDVDTALAGRIDGFTNNVGTMAVAPTDEEVRRADQYLNDAAAPTTERFWAVSPAQLNALMGIDKYMSKDYMVASFSQGQKGTLYTHPLYMTQNLEGDNTAGHDNVFAHKSAIAIVRQMKVTMESQYVVKRLAHQTVAHQIYGHQEMRDDHGVWWKGM
jgi:hypothetical protein